EGAGAPGGGAALASAFPPAEKAAYGAAPAAFRARLAAAAENEPDVPASALLDPNSRWNGLIGAVSTYMSGVEPDRLSVHDFARYHDSGVNWRVPQGLGATVAAHAGDVPVALGCAVHLIDRSA